jgi:hypothetical protein
MEDRIVGGWSANRKLSRNGLLGSAKVCSKHVVDHSETDCGLALLCSCQNALLFILNTTCANSCDFSGTQPVDIALLRGAAPNLRWRMETYSGLKMDKIGFVEISEIKERSRARGQRREVVVTSWLDAKCISLPASVDRLRRAR